jgi:hypothetical protein
MTISWQLNAKIGKIGREKLGMFDLHNCWDAGGDDFFTLYHTHEELLAAHKARKKEQGL